MIQLKLIPLLFFVQLYRVTVQQAPECKYNEVVIVMDTSGTIEDPHFQQAKRLAKKIVNELTLSDGSNSDKVGVATYAEKSSKRIYCDEHVSNTGLNSAIDSLNRIDSDGELTNTEAGLRSGHELLRERGCKPKSNKHVDILILISDGKANRGLDQNGPNATAASIRADGVKIIAIGVGDSITYSEIVGISGSKDNAFLGDTIDDNLETKVLNKARAIFCQDVPSPQPPTTTPEVSTTGHLCNCDIDGHFLKVSSFTKYEIIRNYNGTCYTDKLKAAIAHIGQKSNFLTSRLEGMKLCKIALAYKITHGYTNDRLFNMYDNCTVNIACAVKKAIWKVDQKKLYLEKELKLELAGFGDLSMTGYYEWFANKFPKMW